MYQIQAGDFLVIYDTEIGLVYMPRSGKLKVTTPDHAKSLGAVLDKYLNGTLNEDENQEIEDYMKRQFGESEKMRVERSEDLTKRDTLRRLEIMVANDCNLRCKYCYAHGGNYGRRPQRLSSDDVINYLNVLLKNRYRKIGTVMFFGGEPTICPSTIKAVCEFFENGVINHYFEVMPVFTMVSNGTLIDDEIAEMIYKYDINVTISVDGPSEINDILRLDKEGKGTFSKIEEGIARMRRHGNVPKLLEATYTKKHMEMGYSKEDIRKYLFEFFGVDSILIANCEEGSDDKELVVNDEQNLIHDNIDYMDKVEMIRIGRMILSKTFTDSACDAGMGSFALMPNGDIYPCHSFTEYPEYQIAHFENGRFIFTNYADVMRKITRVYKVEDERCFSCWAMALCQLCPANKLMYKEKNLEITCNSHKEFLSNYILSCAKKFNQCME